MRHALQLAENVLPTPPNPRVGCVIVAAQGDNLVVGEGWHQQPGGAHAEINCLAQAGTKAKGSTVFVSLEPCAHYGKTPPCAEALINAEVSRVVIAALDPFPEVAGRGVSMLEDAGIEVIHLTDFMRRAKSINAGYYKRLTTGMPFVRCKLAMSLDGRTAAANGESKWITGPKARSEVQRLRAGSCAIITGINTVLQDDPSLTVRSEELALSEVESARNGFALARQPLRVVMDSQLRIPESARLLQHPGSTKLFSCVNDAKQYPGDTEIVCMDPDSTNQGRVDPSSVLELLAAEFAVNEVLLEAGPTLSGAFVQAGLVDELVIYIAGKLLGSNGRPLMELPLLRSMSDQIELSIDSVSRIGEDCRIVATFHTA
ncbi:MAG: bifunctional diaminohydroxyphosphoribosylaminopyrimidine deaminase/5-amino-6-(5-phosphoribosylamino)uracil reductase RibD [Gammaproteobacteria bacterium]|nr:bifunctional diaminohydroxyphosphoribosylaminopyrimidine deaminase/5-amino-6-(5-phosphoribosylamino)uracil reductase RibD [Gammaproteobacteria bacterium]